MGVSTPSVNLETDADDHIWCTNVMIFLRKLCDSEKFVPPGKILRLSGPLLEVYQTISAAGNKSRGIHGGSDTTQVSSI